MSGITIDPLYIHADDLGEAVGNFHETAIITWDPRSTVQRDDADMSLRIAASRLYAHRGIANAK